MSSYNIKMFKIPLQNVAQQHNGISARIEDEGKVCRLFDKKTHCQCHISASNMILVEPGKQTTKNKRTSTNTVHTEKVRTARMDLMFLILFPCIFVIFNLVYWIGFLYVVPKSSEGKLPLIWRRLVQFKSVSSDYQNIHPLNGTGKYLNIIIRKYSKELQRLLKTFPKLPSRQLSHYSNSNV